MSHVTIKPLVLHKDQRGVVFEPVTPLEIESCRNIHVVLSHPGVVRGNHYHRIGSETAAVEGPALVRYQQDGEVKDCKVPSKEVWQFRFPPGIAHAIQNTGIADTVIVAANTHPHDPEHPDTCSKILIPCSVGKK